MPLGIDSRSGAKPREDWLFDWPNAMCIVGTQLTWAIETTETLAKVANDKDALEKYNKVQIEQLVALIKMVQGELTKETGRLWLPGTPRTEALSR